MTQQNWGDKGFVGYRVANDVSAHEGYGIGVYHYFRDFPVVTTTGIVAPDTATFVSPLGVFLNGQGTMQHILNHQGGATGPSDPSDTPGAHVQWLCSTDQDCDLFFAQVIEGSGYNKVRASTAHERVI